MFRLEPEGDDDEDVEKPPRVEEILRQLEPDEIAAVDLKKLKGQIALLEGVSAPSLPIRHSR